MHYAWFRWVPLATALALAGCTSAGGGSPGPGDAATEGIADGATGDATDAYVPPPCPPPPQPVATVAVDAYFGQPAFHVDATEVTQADYCQFLAVAPDPSMQDAICRWNKSFAPSTSGGCSPFTPMANPGHPMVCVNWCDAAAYCKSVGKRLCGARGGGALDPFQTGSGDEAGVDRLVNLAEYDEWFAACSHDDDGQHVYSVGSSMGAHTCNGPANMAGGPVDVASISTCTGGFPGIFDMSGNVWEWENACPAEVDAGGCQLCDAGSPPDQATCRARGGAYDGNLVDLDCRLTGPNDMLLYKRSDAPSNVGFRCCSD